MIKIIPAALFFLSFFTSLISNAVLRRISLKFDILIDKPDKERKFHLQPTPLTGGIGISIGIIFSAFFLFFFTELNYKVDVSQENLIGNEQNILSGSSKTKNTSSIDFGNGNELKIEKLDENSFLVQLPSGEKMIYEVDLNEGESRIISQDELKIIKNLNSNISLNNFSIGLILFTLIVQVVMTLDDLWGLRATTRLSLQTLCVLSLILFSDVYISNLGNLFGFGELYLGIFGIPFTVFAIVGMMNAFNMIDGLDGLCASICLVSFSGIIFMINANEIPSLFPLILPVGAIIGFLVYNLGVFGKNRMVFLGDNGSNALGFLCAWIMVYFSSVEESTFFPVTALWLVAIPLLDAIFVIFSRYLGGIMPLNPGRDHIHHRLNNFGFSNQATYLSLVTVSILFCIIGLTLNSIFTDMHFISFYAFLVIWLMYYLFIKFISKNV